MFLTAFEAWWSLAVDTATMVADAQSVIGMRLMRLAGGGELARSEAGRMVLEKQLALAEAQVAMAAAFAKGTAHDAPRDILDNYSRRVRANHKRLSR